jgi:polysaccharide export outer membrane protein
MRTCLKACRVCLRDALPDSRKILSAAFCVYLCFANTTLLYAQALGPASAGSTGQTQLNPFGFFQQGQYPPCTPADYGDPNANCVPINNRSGFGPTGSYGNLYGANSSIPSQNDMSAYPSAYAYPMQQDQNRELPSSTLPPARYPKEPPTEFQRFVSASTGQMLPIFGSTLFEQVPATFAPLDRVPVSPDYLISAGDELQLSVWGQVNFTRRFVVDRTGTVMLPEVGPVSVTGLNYTQAAAAFKSAMAHVYKNFDLSVTLGRLHPIEVFVVGEARRPGTYTVSSFSTLVNAIFASGGPSNRGSMREIQLKRGNQTIRDFDLYDLLVRGDKSNDAQLQPGDVILIPPAGARIAVAGSVEHAGIYELKPGTNLRDVLRLASGLSPTAAGQQIILERVSERASLEVQRVPMNNAGLATELHNGDIIRLLPVVPRFANAVVLKGNVADPGRFPWFSGMKISDLIPDKDFLLTRDYWNSRNNISGVEQADTNSGTKTEESTQSSGEAEKKTQAPADPSGQGQRLLAFASPNGVQTPLFREQATNPQSDRSLSAATEGDRVPPVRDFLPRNFVQPSAPDINWQYASIERIDKDTLATRIIPFNLGKLVISHDAAQDLPLEPGDVVTIFSKADFSVPSSQQLKQVRIEGEVQMGGVYTLLPGETLRSLVKRAGGLTQNAYLYGAQFTRDSTRREQQKRYDDFLSQLEREMNESAANLSSRVISPQQAATAPATVASQRDLIERLRKVSMNGRIVLDLVPHSHGLDALPDLPLENGDRLYVPGRPSTVNVIGTVFQQASFLYEEDMRVSDYLKKSGGPSRSADRSHMFVIRADGSVVSRTTGTTALFARSFDSLPVYPGDTVVVPSFINKGTFARSLMDWSQIFSNLALGTAAVNVLR